MNYNKLWLMTGAKIQILEHIAALARVLGHAHRLDLLEHISQGERSVERLADLAKLSVANTSQHLQQLRRGGFVQSRRDGNRILYRLGDGPVLDLLSSLRCYAESSRAEIREIFSACFSRLDDFEPVSRGELVARLAARQVTLLDMRPRDEFALGHLPGAINIQLDDLERRLSELPAQQEIVAYCRGAYCVLSFEAVALLRAKGFNARRLEDGFPEWKAAGLAVEAA